MDYLIEASFSLGMFINALLFIPQAIEIIRNKASKNVSFITFFGFLLIQLSVLMHGLLREDYLLAIGTFVSMITCGWVVILILYYQIKNTKLKPKKI